MTVDQYAPCPCGSGKKLKFCKCVDNLQDYEKLLRLVNGGQLAAAIDRIDSLLSKKPNAAWLLAVKCDLYLRLQDYGALRECVNRFLRLRPENPLAQALKALTLFGDDPSEEQLSEAVRYVVRVLSESRDGIPPVTVPVLHGLVRTLLANGMELMACYWYQVLEGLQDESHESSESPYLAADINLLAKSMLPILRSPVEPEWKERLKEVQALSGSLRFEQAEKKLLAILRDYPERPVPLSHLLQAQIYLLEQQAAFETCRKLASHPDLPEQDRALFFAHALHLDPDSGLSECRTLIKSYEIDSVADVVQRLSNVDFVTDHSGASSEAYFRYLSSLLGESVPPSKVYFVYEHASASNADAANADAEAYPGLAAILVLFGKETDKPARANYIGLDLQRYRTKLDELVERMHTAGELKAIADELDFHFVTAFYFGEYDAVRVEDQIDDQQRADMMISRFLDLPIAALDSRTPREVSEDPAERYKILALLRYLEGAQSQIAPLFLFDQLYARLGLERTPVPLVVDDHAVQTRLVDMPRVQIDSLSAQELRHYFIWTTRFSAIRQAYHAALAVLALPELENETSLSFLAYQVLFTASSDVDLKIDYSNKLEHYAKQLQKPMAPVLWQRFMMFAQLERQDEAMATLKAAMENYPDDESVHQMVQYIVQGMTSSMQQSPTASGFRDSPAPGVSSPPHAPLAGTEDSGLVLPGQPSSPAEGKSSGLWLPGDSM